MICMAFDAKQWHVKLDQVAHLDSRRQSLPCPGPVLQRILEAVMQPGGAAVPELDGPWPHKVPTPVVGPRNLPGLISKLLQVRSCSAQSSNAFHGGSQWCCVAVCSGLDQI